MYSAIERQQSRVDAEDREMQTYANKLRNKRERERRRREEELHVALSEDDEEERQRWLETIALERRYQKLQKEKERER